MKKCVQNLTEKHIMFSYLQSFVIMFVRNVQFSCYVNIFHGDKALMFWESFFNYVNSWSNIIGFIVTPKKINDKMDEYLFNSGYKIYNLA